MDRETLEAAARKVVTAPNWDNLEALRRALSSQAELNTAAGNGGQSSGQTDSQESPAAERCQSAVPRLCKDDGKPCPESVAGKGRGESRCEQNGVCQRINMNDLPILKISENGSLKVEHNQSAVPQQNAAPQESVKETGREIGDTPAVAAPLTLPKPVAYVVRTISDGSIGSIIAPVNYTMFERRLEALKDDSWVKIGKATIAPLYDEALFTVASQAIERMEAAEAKVAALTKWLRELYTQRESFHMTFNGGHHEEPAHSAFHHGMDTVFNWLERDVSQAAARSGKEGT